MDMSKDPLLIDMVNFACCVMYGAGVCFVRKGQLFFFRRKSESWCQNGRVCFQKLLSKTSTQRTIVAGLNRRPAVSSSSVTGQQDRYSLGLKLTFCEILTRRTLSIRDFFTRMRYICCTHRVNHGELSQCFKHDDSTINIVLVLLLLLLLLVCQVWNQDQSCVLYLLLYRASTCGSIQSEVLSVHDTLLQLNVLWKFFFVLYKYAPQILCLWLKVVICRRHTSLLFMSINCCGCMQLAWCKF